MIAALWNIFSVSKSFITLLPRFVFPFLVAHNGLLTGSKVIWSVQLKTLLSLNQITEVERCAKKKEESLNNWSWHFGIFFLFQMVFITLLLRLVFPFLVAHNGLLTGSKVIWSVQLKTLLSLDHITEAERSAQKKEESPNNWSRHFGIFFLSQKVL